MDMEDLVRNLISLLDTTHLNCDRQSQKIVSTIKSNVLSEISETQLDFDLSVLFRRENSLLIFISNGCSKNTIKGGIKDSLDLVKELLNKYSKEMSQYFVSIKEVCFEVVTRNCGADVHKSAYEVIKTIVNSKESIKIKEDLKIKGIIDFLHSRGLSDRTLKPVALRGVYELYGAIASKFPEYCSASNINSVVRSILHHLNDQMRNTNSVKLFVIEGCMNGLNGVLGLYCDGDNTDTSETVENIYKYVKDACTFRNMKGHRVHQRAALDVFTNHIHHLWGCMIKLNDFKFWLENLAVWAAQNSSEDKYTGIRALRSIHNEAMKYLSANPEHPLKKIFMDSYRRTMISSKAADHETELAIEGISVLAGLSGGEVNQGEIALLFRVILQRVQGDFALESETGQSDRRLAKYLDCLSKICTKLRSVTNDQLSAIIRLWRTVVERLPYHHANVQFQIVKSLVTTVINMGMCDTTVFEKFMFEVVYQSIIVTCSHTLVEEAELQKELTGKEVVTYKNYEILWKDLLNIAYESRDSSNLPGIESRELRSKIMKKLYNSFIESLIVIVNKLNVGYKRDDSIEEVKSDPENSLKSEVPQDHSILCNLANLYRDLLPRLEPDNIEEWLAKLIPTVINQSVRFPLVSAFYKLLAAILSVAQKTEYFCSESEDVRSLGDYVVRYMEDVMLHCHHYKNDLQASCLLAIIAVPTPLIDTLLAGMAPIMQMIFQLGQSLLSLAHHGMDALELWQRKLRPDQVRPILQLVLPLFDPYLRSRGITTELPDEEGMQLSKRQQKRERLIQEATQLSELQRRMLRLLSCLDSATCLKLLTSPTDVTAWTARPIFGFKMPFPDQRFNVIFDPLLPRVVDLALTSSDRHTKAAACEALHTLVLLFIGNSLKTVVVVSEDKAEIVKVLARLVPVLLRLSCGSDLVARQLFHPLTLQLMHWFSKPDLLDRNPELTQAVLEAVWEGITDERDTALQDFSALCLQEFVAWSIKQTSVKEMEEKPAGPKAIIRWINRLCLHPSVSKRRGAALAFSHVARSLREEASLVDRFWLGLVYHLVRNLEAGEGDDHPALAALARAEKVVRARADVFNQVSETRQVPAELGGGQLRDLLKFLLRKCGSKTPICAAKCRELVASLTPLVDGSPRPDQLVDMIEVCEGAGNGSVLPFQPSVADVDHLRASIDCYAWALKKGFISPAVVFMTPNRSSSRLVACIEYFVNLLEPTVVPTEFHSRNQFTLARAKFDLVVALFDLISIAGEDIKYLPFTFFDEGFQKLLAVCIFSPCNIGLDWRNREHTDSLNNKLRLLLRTLRDYLDGATLSSIHAALSSRVLYDCDSCINHLNLLCQNLQQLRLQDRQFVDALITLHKTDFLQNLKHGTTWDGNALVKGVFSSVFNSDGLPLHPEASVRDFAQQILHLAVLLGANVKTSLDCIMDCTEVKTPQVSSSQGFSKGMHFVKLFKDCLVAHLLQDPDLCVTKLLTRPSTFNMDVVLLMLEASKYSKVKYNRSAEALFTSLAGAWGRLEVWPESQSWLVPLLKAMLQLPPPAQVVGSLGAGPVSGWLLRLIKDPDLRLEHKAELVELLPCVVCERTDAQLEDVLSYLLAQFPVSTQELRVGSVERSTFKAVYTALLHTLVTAGSVTVLRAVCESAADSDHACADAVQTALVEFMDTLKKYAQHVWNESRRKPEVQIEALRMVHEKFLNESLNEEFRLGLMSRFLITMLSNASNTAVIDFYKDRIQNIIQVLDERLRLNDQEWKSKQQLVSKIGAFRLIEILYLRINKTEMEKPEHPVFKAADPCIPGSENKKLTKYIALKLLEVKKQSCAREELKEPFRRYQCAAYNALLLFLCNTDQNIHHFSVIAFDDKKDIWRSIVPTEPKYSFPIDFEDYPRRKKQLVQIRGIARGGVEEEAANVRAIYLPSQSLFSSTLQEDITDFDFSLYNVRDADRMQQVLTKEDEEQSAVRMELEDDCLNNHECMSTLILAIKQYCEKYPAHGEKGKCPQPPEWMTKLRASLTAPDQPDNCRAFIVKLIFNCENYFKPYAHYWISPIIKCVLDGCLGSGINCLVHDIVCMLCNWYPVAIPDSTTEDRLNASEFLRLLVKNSYSESKKVFDYNIKVIRCLVEMWKSFLTVPYQELLDLVAASPETTSPFATRENPGIMLADVFLAHDILPFNQTGKSVYYSHLLVHLKSSHQKTYKTCAAVVGKILRCVSSDGSLDGEDLEFYKQVVEVIRPKEGTKNHQHFITCLYEIKSSYSPIIKGFEAQCIGLLNKYPAKLAVNLVEILTTALDCPNFRKEAFSMLPDLPQLLSDGSNPDKQFAALEMVGKLKNHLEPAQMSKLLPEVEALKNHKQVKTRAAVFNIVSWIYDNYRQLENDTAASQVEKAKAMLLWGLADPDKNLRDEYYNFWRERLPSQGWSRLVEILRLLYSPACEPTFLTVTNTLLLGLCEKTDEYKQKIFEYPLSDKCVFQKYEVSGSFRTRHAAFVPMFANTVASQISSLSMGSFELNFQIRATQPTSSFYSATLETFRPSSSVQDQSWSSLAGPSSASGVSFGLKYKQGSSFGSDYLDDNDTVDRDATTSGLPKLARSREVLVRDKQKESRKFAEINRAKSAQREQYKAERQKKREGEVTLTRSYRKGDLPDIQIPCSELLTALITLADRDHLIARQLLIAVYKGLIDANVNADVQGVSSSLDGILQKSTSYEPALMATVMEMGLVQAKHGVNCDMDASIITQVCKNSHQMSVGALLVESKLMVVDSRPPAHKRMRRDPRNCYNEWMYLAEIYHSLEEMDVVQGLFEDKIAEACSVGVREALQAEDQARWKMALIKYTECLATQKGSAVENFLYEASFKCYAHLSEWKDLNQSLKRDLLEDKLDEVWNENWNKDHLLPWLFLSEIHCSQSKNNHTLCEDFNSALNSWLEDPVKRNQIESKLAEMLSVVLVLRGDVARARKTSDDSVTHFLSVWQQLDSLNNHLRGSRLLGVHRLIDTELFLGLPPVLDGRRCWKVKEMLTRWEEHSPSTADNLVSWDTQATYRNIFMRKLETEADETQKKIVGSCRFNNYLKTLECSLKQRNFYVSKSYHKKILNEMGVRLDEKSKNRMPLLRSKVCLLSAVQRVSSPDKVNKILKVWEPLDGLLEQEAAGTLDYKLDRELQFHKADVYKALLGVMQDQPSVMDSLSADDEDKLSRLGLRGGDVVERVKNKVVGCLDQAVAVTSRSGSGKDSELADAYLQLTVFCHEISNDEPQYREKLIESLLRAMKYGSSEARILFPCLLESSLARHADLFISESNEVPEWMFLSWVAQLLAHLDTEIGHAVAPLLLRLASSYPTAVQFPFHLSREIYQYNNPGTRSAVDQLSEKLRMDRKTTDLLRALSCVCQPRSCLKYHLHRIITVISQGLDNDAIENAYNLMRNEAFPPQQNDKIKGPIFNQYQELTVKLEEAYYQFSKYEISKEDFKRELEITCMKVDGTAPDKQILLENYSPWLVKGYRGGVEIPGQYTGDGKPLPNHHVTIAAFKENVVPLASMRCPIKITIIGSDAREYPFMVKFGEDLRQDQRIQQLFKLMNQLLGADPATSRRQLSVQTYSVVPLNNRFGIIQWVENTTDLGSFMASGHGGDVKNAENIYIEHAGRCDKNNPTWFYQNVTKEESVVAYQNAVNELPSQMLRDAVYKLSTGPEAFVHLRSVMLTDHACLSICHWLLGIGDRHLNNTLVCESSGRLLGIDFGYAFGTSTQSIKIPELVPVRLTPQILNLAAPFGTTGLIKETMVNTLRVLRENRRLLVAAMTVFVLEPTVDWLTAARKNEAYSTDSDDWFPRKKISLVCKKLEGAHPRSVMNEDLEMGHSKRPHYNKLKELLWDGVDPNHEWDTNEKLSPRQQVDYLIEHATNLHILSKTYVGWVPYM